jgi:outer membrane protein
VLASLASFSARAGETGFDGWGGVFQLLLRGVYLEPQNHSVSEDQSQLHLDGGAYVELSASWFMTPVFSMELSLAQVSNFDATIEEPNAAIESGHIRMMPNTWTLRYHFAPGSTVRPYLGAGLHYTTLAIHPVVNNSSVGIERSKVGWVLQAGVDVRLSPEWILNADVRYLGSLDPELSVNGGSQHITGYINPLLFGAGVAYRW